MMKRPLESRDTDVEVKTACRLQACLLRYFYDRFFQQSLFLSRSAPSNLIELMNVWRGSIVFGQSEHITS